MLDKYKSVDVPTISSLQQEIETLRQQNEDTLIEFLKAQKRGDEWKRRAKEMWGDMDLKSLSGLIKDMKGIHSPLQAAFIRRHPEAAKWFEAEGFQSSIEGKDDE